MAYLGNSPGVASQRVETALTATASQTVFTPSSGYTLGYCDVYQNGVKLVNGDDYTAANGTTITLATGAAEGDSIVIVASFPRGLSDGYLKTEADAKYLTIANPTASGNLTFTGTGNRITGDFSNATVANRAAFQTSTANGNTLIPIAPNGTSNNAQIIVYNDSALANGGTGQFAISSSELRIAAGLVGTSTYLPMTFYTGGSERIRIDTSGNVGIGTNAATKKLVVSDGGAIGFEVSPNDGGLGDTRIFAFNRSTTSYTNLTVQGQDIKISTGTGTTSTERMRINSSGNIGVNTTQPQAKFEACLAASAYNTVMNANAVNDIVVLRAPFGYTEGTAGSTSNGGARWGLRMVGRNDGSYDNAKSAGIYAVSEESGAAYNRAVGLAFHTSAFDGNHVERARIDSSGNLLVGTSAVPSSSQAGVMVKNPTVAYSAWSSGSYTGLIYHIGFLNGNGLVGRIETNGSSTSFITSSDYRLKHDVQPMTGALQRVANLKPVAYKWNADNSDGEGFLAHELAAVCPLAVSGEKDETEIEQYEISPAVPAAFDDEGNELTPAVAAVMGEREVPRYQGIDTSFLVATLTAAIQEQQAIIEQLRADVETLKGAQA